VRHLRHVGARHGCGGFVSGVSDYSAQAFSGGREFVFEFLDGPLGCVCFDGAGVAVGNELAVAGFQCCDPGDELGPLWSFDLGAEV
jgi:hypothetical protein